MVLRNKIYAYKQKPRLVKKLWKSTIIKNYPQPKFLYETPKAVFFSTLRTVLNPRRTHQLCLAIGLYNTDNAEILTRHI